MILIINPPSPPGVTSNKDTMGGIGQVYQGNVSSLTPLDILFEASILQEHSQAFKLYDCLTLEWDSSVLVTNVCDNPSDFIFIRTSLPTLEWDLSIAKILKKISNSKIIFIGPIVEFKSHEILSNSFVDAIIAGNFFYRLLEIASNNCFKGVANVWYKNEDMVIKNEKCAFTDVDSLPIPAWNLVNYKQFQGGDLMNALTPFVTCQTSWGCPFACSYCPYTLIQGRKILFRSVEKVIAELKYLSKELGVKSILFRDPEFSIDKTRVESLCHGIIEHDIPISWRCETRVTDLTPDLIRLMSMAGCIGINAGYESADEKILKGQNRKAVNFKFYKKIIDDCKKNNIKVFLFVILGLPGETEDTFKKTLKNVIKLHPAFVQFTLATPYPGTELFTWAEKNNYITSYNYSEYTSYNAVMRTENFNEKQLEALRNCAYKMYDLAHKSIFQLNKDFIDNNLKWLYARFIKYT